VPDSSSARQWLSHGEHQGYDETELRTSNWPSTPALNFLLLTLTLSLHLACMNAATAGPLVGVGLDWREGRGDLLAGRAGRFLATTSLAMYLFGMALGLAVAWLAWTPAFWRELRELLPSRIYWGMWELGFSALLLSLYAGWWRLAPGGKAARIGRSVIALLTATNLMYHFPPLFVVAATLSAGETAALGALDDAALPRLVWRGEVAALTVHFWLASLAVAGVLLALFGLRRAAEDCPSQERPARMAVWGGVLALVPTLLQIPVGLWVMVRLSPLRQSRLMNDALGMLLLGAGVLLALWLMHQLAALAIGDTRRGTILRAAILLAAVIALMTAALRYSRPVTLRDRVESVQDPYRSSSRQSIAPRPASSKAALAWEKGLLPKNPFLAERGEGWAAVSTVWRSASIRSILSWAYLPQSKNTTGSSCSLTARITSSVNTSQPLPLCEAALCARTVSTALSRNTPWSAHAVRQPWLGMGHPRSFFNSLKMFFSEGGGLTPGFTEKHKPWAWPSS
jgi:hypothetical protein